MLPSLCPPPSQLPLLILIFLTMNPVVFSIPLMERFPVDNTMWSFENTFWLSCFIVSFLNGSHYFSSINFWSLGTWIRLGTKNICHIDEMNKWMSRWYSDWVYIMTSVWKRIGWWILKCMNNNITLKQLTKIKTF